ncbi:MAG: crotonobetainyl-CoA--carnitine CoA-transferase [Pseudodesulfovibrio sp.]|nr:crotonobetainyl-CoA--carnitine CoA-transferase [Pseudodesulfovibrio sp.]
MSQENTLKTKFNASEGEQSFRGDLKDLYKACPIIEDELFMNLPLFTNRQNLSHILYMNELYQQITSVHGVIFELGVRWGRNLALYESFRGIYEPYNHNRKIVGFDTFCGFPSVDVKDGESDVIKVGAYSVTDDYDKYLEEILNYHEKESPISHIKKFELRKGDAVVEVERYLEEHQETIVSLAYFDFDIYEPTKRCLDLIKNRLTRGSIIAFDELNCSDYPGETRAVMETFGLDKYKINHSKFSPTQSYIVID